MAAVVLAISCAGRAGLMGVCGRPSGESPAASERVVRTIPLKERWEGEHGRLCWREIRVLDRGFRMIGHFEGRPSWADPWYTAFFLGGPRSRIVDESGRAYQISGLSSRGPVVITVDGLFPPTADPAPGDLLTGVRRLTLELANQLEPVAGPWVFSFPARPGPLEVKASARGRELRLHDLVVAPDSFSVGFMELDSYSPPFVGIRSTYNEFAPAKDSGGRSYAVVGRERIGSSNLLYMKFAPAPPPDVMLTITLERIFVTTDRTWRGDIKLP